MSRTIFALIVLLLVFSGSIFADEEFKNPKWGEIENWEWEYQPPTEYQNAEAVILFDYGKVEVELRGTKFKRHLRLKVFKPENLIKLTTPLYRKKDFRDIFITYYLSPESSYTPNELIYNEQESFQWCYAEKTIENLQSQGFIVELEYTIDYDSTYLPEWFFDNKWLTLKSTYLVSIGGGYNYSYWSENVPEAKSIPVETRKGGLVGSFYRVFNWQLEKAQPYSLTDANSIRRESSPIVYFKLRLHGNTTLSNLEPFTNMDNVEIATEIILHMEDYLRKSKGAKTFAQKAVSGIKDKYDRVAAIYKYVCDEIETLPSIRFDEQSQKFLKNMIESGKGTVLEKSYLFIKMLDKIGVEAWPVLISTTDHGKYNIQYPDSRQFNHLIVRAEINPDEFVFCDLRQTGIAFGNLPDKSKVSGGLLIHDRTPSPVRVK